MKKCLSFLVLLVSLAACQQDEDSLPNANLFEVSKDQTMSVPVTGVGEVSVTLKSVVDSRCPTGAQCIWAGNATTGVQLKAGSAAAQTVALCLGQCATRWHNRDSVAVELNQQPYWLLLTAVNPYPSLQEIGTSKTATLSLIRQ